MDDEIKMQAFLQTFFKGFQCNKYCCHIVQRNHLQCSPRWGANGHSKFFSYHEFRLSPIPCQHYVIMKL